MAFIDQDMDDPVKISSFYNVEAAVGYGGKNLVEDVKVIQFFLQRVFMGIKENKNLKPWGTMVVDGKCGPITRAWITHYQSELRLHDYNCLVDGKIDRAGNATNTSNWESSYSHTNYTIRLLNRTLRKYDSEVYKNLTTHPMVPADVKLIFLKIQAQGPPMHYFS